MGFFSFMTSDSNESISNSSSRRGAFTVYMLDDKGNVWTEHEYEGYGVFGEKDYFELFAEMNGKASDDGITLWHQSTSKDDKFPFLTRNKHAKWRNVKTKRCEFQGYFYYDDEEEVDDDDVDEDVDEDADDADEDADEDVEKIELENDMMPLPKFLMM
jgi:hypothetical protein